VAAVSLLACPRLRPPRRVFTNGDSLGGLRVRGNCQNLQGAGHRTEDGVSLAGGTFVRTFAPDRQISCGDAQLFLS